MSDSLLVNALACYVPAPVAREAARDPRPLTAPRRRSYRTAALFADVSGFTSLTERMGARGSAGAEDLSQILNAYFSELLAVVHAHGGDVTGFAGDALFAIWPALDGDEGAAVGRATSCAIAMQARLHAYDAGAGVRLSLRIAVGMGEGTEMEVGGVRGRWQHVLGGAPIEQVSAAEQLAAPGEVVLSPEAATLVEADLEGPTHERGFRTAHALRNAPSPRPSEFGAIDPSAVERLRSCVSEAILARLDAGQSDWLAELRLVTVAFVGLGGLALDEADSLDRLHAAIGASQALIDRFEGSLLRLGVDDKGTRLLIAFGAPPRSHEDDAARAVRASLAMRDQLRTMGIVPSIGIATGRAFCGRVGSPQRGEYTVIGDVANLAARLMQAARDDVLCDASVQRAARGQCSFETLPALTVKGKALPVQVYRPTDRREDTQGQPAGAMVGRREERAALSSALNDLASGRLMRAHTILIEAEAGLGKSRLVQALLEEAGHLGDLGTLLIAVGSAEAVEQTSAYHPWRSIVRRLLEVGVDHDPADERAHVLAVLAEIPELERFAPLLNAVLPLAIPENDVTEVMSGDVRAFNTRAVIAGLVRRSLQRAPVLIVLEDAHWSDSASWALLRDVAAITGSLLIVAAQRPLTDPLPSEYRTLVESPDTQVFRLGAMSGEEALAIVQARLGVTSLPESVEKLIVDRGQGNPFFSEEIAYALRDSGLIEVVDGECRLAAGANLSEIDFPDTVQGVIIGRIDRLSPQLQLTLKVASVIGRAFASRIVRDVYPIEAERLQLTEFLVSLGSLDLTPMETPPPEDTYVFKHVITQEVAYNLMLFAQRRELHRRAAEWYEWRFAGNLEPHYPLLAYHWSRTDVVSRTIEYMEMAGDQAIRQGTYREAVGFFAAALELEGRSADGGDRLRRARWEASLAEAHHGLTQLPEARLHYERALALLGEPPPRSRVGWAGLLGRSLVQQFFHQAFPGVVARRRRVDARSSLLADVYAKLAFVYYHQNDKLTSITTSVRGLNVAELGGPERIVARLSSNMGVASALIPVPPLVDRFGRRAVSAAASADDPYIVALVNTSLGWAHLGMGRWESARREIDTAVEIYRRIGELRLLDESLLVQAVSRRSGPLSPIADMFEAIHESARRRGDTEVQAWALALGSWSLLARGHVDRALDWLHRAEPLLSGHSARTGFIKLYGVLGVAYLRAGDPALAARAADTAYRAIAQATPILVSTFDGYAGCVETYLTLWERGDRQYREQAHLALKKLDGLARVFPICRPRAWLYRGRIAAADGRPQRALDAWRRGRQIALDLEMPYEAARARYEIGRHLPEGDAERRRQFEEAARVFEAVDATHELGLVLKEAQRA